MQIIKNATKAMSYSTTDIAKMDGEIHHFLEKTQGSYTRHQIAEQLDMVESSVCGAVNRLIASGLAHVVGNTPKRPGHKIREIVSAVANPNFTPLPKKQTKKDLERELEVLQAKLTATELECAQANLKAVTLAKNHEIWKEGLKVSLVKFMREKGILK